MPLPPLPFAEIGASAWVGEQAGQGERSAETGTVLGVGLRLRPSERWAVELRGGHGPSGWDPALDLHHFVGNASADIVPSLVVGGGWESTGSRPFAALGGGLDVQLHDRVDLRADTRLRVGLDGSAALLFTVGPSLHASRRFDLDRDGLADRNDRCPDVAEDPDGHDDADGCPEIDNDLDGIADTGDRCPDVPEDRDGFLDADGCPEPDNDGDGLDDARDLCIAAPEDRDSFQDEDGCPDLDDDSDGRADSADACPRAPEDADGFEDEDGCPEADNDQDGVPDTADAAPGTPENRNGWEDDDGAPDVVPRVLARFVGALPRVRFEPDPARRTPVPQGGDRALPAPAGSGPAGSRVATLDKGGSGANGDDGVPAVTPAPGTPSTSVPSPAAPSGERDLPTLAGSGFVGDNGGEGVPRATPSPESSRAPARISGESGAALPPDAPALPTLAASGPVGATGGDGVPPVTPAPESSADHDRRPATPPADPTPTDEKAPPPEAATRPDDATTGAGTQATGAPPPLPVPHERLTERARETLETLADVLDAYPRVRVEITVSALRPGQGAARGDLVAAALTAEGIDPARVRVVAGEGAESVTLALVP